MAARSDGRTGSERHEESAQSLAPPRIATGFSLGRPADGAYPHSRRRGKADIRHVGPLGSRRQCGRSKVVDAWAQKNKVEVTLDFLSTNGEKIDITMAAEAQARRGHDIYAFDQWTVHQWSEKLDPVDDVVQSLIAQYGPVAGVNEYLGKVSGHWMAVPTSIGSGTLPPCARISMLKNFAGIDVQAWYPPHESTPEAAADWTYATQLRAAEACARAGYKFALGCGVDDRLHPDMGRNVRSVRRRPRGRQGQRHRRFRQRPHGAGICRKAAAVPAAGYGELRQRVEQPRADFRQECVDLEPAVSLGGGEARRAAGRRGLLALPDAGRAERQARCRIARTSGASGTLRRTRVRPRICCITSCSATTWSSWRRLRRAMTFRRSRRCRTSASGRRSSRRKARCTTTRSGPGTMQSTTSPDLRRRRRSRCKCGIARIIPGMVAKLFAGKTIEQSIAWAKDELEGFAR